MKIYKLLFLAATFALTSCSHNSNGTLSATDQPAINGPTPFHICSNAFKEGDSIPAVYTCDSSNISPQLHWNNPAKNTVSYALIVDDPDAPNATWVHWILYNIPANDTLLNTNTPKDSMLASGAKQGIPSFGRPGYGGPCPPNGVHHYHFKLFALDAILPYPAGLGKNKLLNAMKGHILAETELVGVYKRKKG